MYSAIAHNPITIIPLFLVQLGHFQSVVSHFMPSIHIYYARILSISPTKLVKVTSPRDVSTKLLGDHNLTPYNHSKNKSMWCDVKCHKRFKCVFLIINWFWSGMTHLMVQQMILELRLWVWVTRVSLWGKDCWEDHNLTPYNHSKNRPTWCDVECHKRFKYVFLIINWFWGKMSQLTVRQKQFLSW